ncbi:hypothetical protein PSPO01_00954 [Paraphaeosphaeria sporulosa]
MLHLYFHAPNPTPHARKPQPPNPPPTPIHTTPTISQSHHPGSCLRILSPYHPSPYRRENPPKDSLLASLLAPIPRNPHRPPHMCSIPATQVYPAR